VVFSPFAIILLFPIQSLSALDLVLSARPHKRTGDYQLGYNLFIALKFENFQYGFVRATASATEKSKIWRQAFDSAILNP
jgi:hypothetical protein